MYKLKEAVRRGSALLGAAGLLVGIGSTMLPAFASADALNPLTERSLTLSSSSPGWSYTDGSGNSTYAPPNSGANGKETGNYFGFKVSSTATVKGFSFQYCTTSAGDCDIPGNDATRGTDTGSTSDLKVTYPSATEVGHNSTAGAGTITVTNGSANVTGSGTSFTTAFVVGGTFKTVGGNYYVIKSITSNTALTLTAPAAGSTETGVTYSSTPFMQVVNQATGLVKAVPGYTDENPKYQAQGGTGDPAEAAKAVTGNFIVMENVAGVWTQSTGWTAAASVVHTSGDTGTTNNYINLINTSGVSLTAGQQVRVLFFANATNYITNPGAGYFFVKINDYGDDGYQNFADNTPNAPVDGASDYTCGTEDMGAKGGSEDCPANVTDGGVTVANVMNQSIQITTKVLETMQFSVGTVDPDTLSNAQLADSDAHANESGGHNVPCDPILTRMDTSSAENVLALGNQAAESSLSTTETYATHSYWRLSSNSSAGATVYYSGHTLSNTSGDEITPIGTTAKSSTVGAEQFGLALDTTPVNGSTGVANLDDGTYGVDYSTAGGGAENGADNTAAGVVAAGNSPTVLGGINDDLLTGLGVTGLPGSPDYTGLNASYHTPKLDPLVPTDGTNGTTNYGAGSGTIGNAGVKFAFDPMSDTVPAEIATENNQVVDCVTGKMRYIANIAATTPAGIYTTKVNYIAAPQY